MLLLWHELLQGNENADSISGYRGMILLSLGLFRFGPVEMLGNE